jgi:hypothetical protein
VEQAQTLHTDPMPKLIWKNYYMKDITDLFLRHMEQPNGITINPEHLMQMAEKTVKITLPIC